MDKEKYFNTPKGRGSVHLFIFYIILRSVPYFIKVSYPLGNGNTQYVAVEMFDEVGKQLALLINCLTF